jgi:hypothetical protein
MYISTLYFAHAKFHRKMDIFCGLCKKDKKCHEKAYFSTKFYHFYIDYIKSRFFLERLHGHVEHGVVTFLFEFF